MRKCELSCKATESIYDFLCLVVSILIRILPPQFILNQILRGFSTSWHLKTQLNLVCFKLYRYTLAFEISRFSSGSLKKYLSSGSICSNLVMFLMEPAFQRIQYSKAELSLINNAKVILSNKFESISLLVALLYLPPYELDSDFSLFSEAIQNDELVQIYIRCIFNTNQFYVLQDESERHLKFSEFAMQKILDLMEKSNEDFCEKIGVYLKYYVHGGIPLMGYSSQRDYRCKRNFLLLECLKVTQPSLFLLPKFPFSLSKKLKKRIGIIRFSLGQSAESEQVFAGMRNPPDGIDLFLFVFDLNERECQQLTDKFPWLKGRVVKLNINDLTGSIKDVREYLLDVIINTSPLSGRFINEISILLSLRVARVQAMFIGDVVTSGIPEVDVYLIPQPLYSEAMQSQFSEKILTMKGLSGVISLLDADSSLNKITRPFQHECILFCSNAHVMKLSPDVLAAWVKILQAVEKSRILLMPFSSENLKIHRFGLQQSILNACSVSGVDPSRFVIIDVAGRSEVCRYLYVCDIYLDTFPYSGSISIFDALSTGKPMITLKGEVLRSRMAAGILEELDLQENMVADTPEKYVDLAVDLAKNKNFRDKISLDIKDAILTHSQVLDSNLSSVEFYRAISTLLVQ